MTFSVGRRPPPDEDLDTVIAQFAQVTTGTLGHLTDFGFAEGLQPLVRPQKAAGPAFTVRLPQLDGTALHYALNLIEPGEVLVVDTSGERRRALWGGVAAHAARVAGVAGVVVDGPVTDWEEVTASGVPVWCRGTSSITARRLGLEGQLLVPVQVAGAVVNPGDVVFADSDGLFFVPRGVAASLVGQLAEREAREPGIKARLDAGEKLADISGAADQVRSGERRS